MRQNAALTEALTPSPDSEVTMLSLSAWPLAAVAFASVSKMATPTVTAMPPLV